jgi:hypothetical protein
MSKINWQYFPKSREIPDHLRQVVAIFEEYSESISSKTNNLSSNKVLEVLRSGLEAIGYTIEKSKKHDAKIKVPVLFGRNGTLEKFFDADGFNEMTKSVLEIEAGRGVTNYQFLKYLFQACMMHDVEYLLIGIRNIYINRKDFETVVTFLDTLYASDRIRLPLKGILVIGY